MKNTRICIIVVLSGIVLCLSAGAFNDAGVLRKAAAKNLPNKSILPKPGTLAVRTERIFDLEETSDTKIAWRGSPLIVSEEISFHPGKPLSELSEKTVVKNINGWKTVNTWSPNKDLPFRKEVAVSDSGKEVELNFCANQPSYHQKEAISNLTYTTKLPLKPFIGMNYTAIHGRSRSPETAYGTLTDTTPNKKLVPKSRWLAFEGNGRKIVFDFNPDGVHTYSDFGPNRIQSMWSVKKTATHLELSFSIRNTEFGGALGSKLRIFEGRHDDFPNRHAHRIYRYYSELPAEMQFCFGAPKHGKSFTQAGAMVYDDDKGFGWNRQVEIESVRQSGAVYTAAKGSRDATFKCRVAQPGLYILTLRCAGYENSRGPFSLSANGKEVFSDLQIADYQLKNITWSQWIEDGELELVFSGKDWAVSSVGVQMLQHTLEDFKFRRGYWIAEDLFEPHPLYASTCFAGPVKHEVAITQIALPKEPITDPETTPVIAKGDVLLPDNDDPAMHWRFNANLGTLGPSNSGSFTEFNTPELIERRLKQIEAKGTDAIIINGMLARHTFPSQLKRVEKNIKDITAAAHQKNMKIIDHQDLTLLWNHGTGFRVMCEKLGMTQRTINENLPTRGFCLTNRAFREQYYDWVTRFIKETDIDGIMIDEACYHGLSYCGCVDCRKKFTADTGLVLPLDETSPLLFSNKKSKLWKTWLQWRIKAGGDFGVGLRQNIASFKPNLTYLMYTTHYGFSSATKSVALGFTMPDAARSRDFLGTEIMSRNVMASHRAVFAFRKAKNALRLAFGSPIFGLVYPLQSANFAYFGWAMNNMNAQVTWKMVARQKDKDMYTGFKENMDRHLAKSVSEIAMLYSIQSRDWGRLSRMVSETLGLSQALTDRHIMHDFFMEESINDEFLNKYSVVIIPNSSCIGREHVETLLKYARQGGTLYLTGGAGLYDQMGNAYPSWPFGEVLGLSHTAALVTRPQIAFVGQTPVDYSKGFGILPITLNQNSHSDIFAEAIDSNGKTQPLAVECKYGKGRIIYCAARFGASNYEAETSNGRKWDYVMDEAINAFNGKMLEKVIGSNKLSFTPVNIPHQVLASVYRQTKEDKTSTIVHLLNATGVKRLEVGQIVPSEAPEPAWPALTSEIVFEISLPSLKQAYVVSPDFQGRRNLQTKKIIADGRYRITVPADALKMYSIIFLEH